MVSRNLTAFESESCWRASSKGLGWEGIDVLQRDRKRCLLRCLLHGVIIRDILL